MKRSSWAWIFAIVVMVALAMYTDLQWYVLLGIAGLIGTIGHFALFQPEVIESEEKGKKSKGLTDIDLGKL